MKRLELCQPFVDRIFESRLLKEISETFRIIFIYFKREKKKKLKDFLTPLSPKISYVEQKKKVNLLVLQILATVKFLCSLIH